MRVASLTIFTTRYFYRKICRRRRRRLFFSIHSLWTLLIGHLFDFTFNSHSQCQCAKVFQLCSPYRQFVVCILLAHIILHIYVTQICPLSSACFFLHINTGECVRLSKSNFGLFTAVLFRHTITYSERETQLCQVKKKKRAFLSAFGKQLYI